MPMPRRPREATARPMTAPPLKASESALPWPCERAASRGADVGLGGGLHPEEAGGDRADAAEDVGERRLRSMVQPRSAGDDEEERCQDEVFAARGRPSRRAGSARRDRCMRLLCRAAAPAGSTIDRRGRSSSPVMPGHGGVEGEVRHDSAVSGYIGSWRTRFLLPASTPRPRPSGRAESFRAVRSSASNGSRTKSARSSAAVAAPARRRSAAGHSPAA